MGLVLVRGSRSWLLLNVPFMEYSAALLLQQRVAAAKKAGRLAEDLLLILEHPSVFTLGNRGGADHLLVSPAFLAEQGIPVVATNRGGDITYHGPGQLLAYPLIDLARAGLGVAAYVARLEETMIGIAAALGVNATRVSQAPGVWCEGRKLGSLGLRVQRGIVSHGLALNVSVDLTPFSWIEPCGLAGTRMSSLTVASQNPVTTEEVRPLLLRQLQLLFDVELQPISLSELEARLG